MIKKLTFRIVLIVLALGFAAVALEAALRVAFARDGKRGGSLERNLMRSRNAAISKATEADFGLIVQASAHPDIVYEFKPNLDCIFRGKRTLTNSRGMRDRERDPAKPDGVFRIVGLGDSVMFGWGVEQDEPYLRVLERALNDLPQPRPAYETLNFAVPGYNTAIEAAVFEHKALAFDPDLVILQFIGNDFGVPSFMLRPKTGLNWTRFYALDFLKARLGRLERAYQDEGLVFQEFRNEDEEMRQNVLKEYNYMCGPKGCREAMARLGNLTKPRGIPVIVIVGSAGADQRAVVAECAAQWGFTMLDIGPYTKRTLAREGIPDTREDWVRVGQVAPSDSHPTPFAHRIYAEGLLDTMRALKLAPGTPDPPRATP